MTSITRGDCLDSRVEGTWGPPKISFVLYIYHFPFCVIICKPVQQAANLNIGTKELYGVCL